MVWQAKEVLALHQEAAEAGRAPIVVDRYGEIQDMPGMAAKAGHLASWLYRKGAVPQRAEHRERRMSIQQVSGDMVDAVHAHVHPDGARPASVSGFVSPDISDRRTPALAKLAAAGEKVQQQQLSQREAEAHRTERCVLGEYPMERTQLREGQDLGKALFEQHITIPPDATKLLVVMATKSGDQKHILEWEVANGATTNVHCVIDSAIGAIHSTSVMLGKDKEEAQVEQKEDWLSHVDLDKLYDFGPDPPDIKIRPH